MITVWFGFNGPDTLVPAFTHQFCGPRLGHAWFGRFEKAAWADPDSYDFCFLLASHYIAEPESGTGCPEFLASDKEIYGRNSFYSILFCILHTSYCYCCKLTPMAGRRPYWPVKGDALASMNGRSGVTRRYIS